jgi:hypothetical protein
MVQAAAQAQAVVAAAKNRGGGLVPMNAAQITALSQIQAQAIVNARPQTALLGQSAGGDSKQNNGKPTTQQIQNQIQLQAQALVHAHTQAQINAGIYKGDDNAGVSGTGTAAAASSTTAAAATTAAASAKTNATTANTAAKRKADTPLKQPEKTTPAPSVLSIPKGTGITLPPKPVTTMSSSQPKKEIATHTHPVSVKTTTKLPPQQYPVIPKSHPQPPVPKPIPQTSSILPLPNTSQEEIEQGVILEPTSPEFLSQLNSALTAFWTSQLQEMHDLGKNAPQSEQDFKNHNDLPLARIKRIMKSDEDVRMISAEAPVLFAKVRVREKLRLYECCVFVLYGMLVELAHFFSVIV